MPWGGGARANTLQRHSVPPRVPGTLLETCSHHLIPWLRVLVSPLPVKARFFGTRPQILQWIWRGFLSYFDPGGGVVVEEWVQWGSRSLKAELVCTHKALKASRYVRNASSSKQQDSRPTQSHATPRYTALSEQLNGARWGLCNWMALSIRFCLWLV